MENVSDNAGSPAGGGASPIGAAVALYRSEQPREQRISRKCSGRSLHGLREFPGGAAGRIYGEFSPPAGLCEPGRGGGVCERDGAASDAAQVRARSLGQCE